MTLAPIQYGITDGTFRTPGGHSVVMRYRLDTNDYNTLNASLDADEYRLPKGLIGFALDVGGYLGSVGIAIALDNPEATVTIVEPVPENADLIARNIECNGVGDRVTLIRGAVGRDKVDVWYRYQGSVSLDHHAFVGNSSLAYDHGGEAYHETITYKGLTLGDFGPIDYMKVDCEGGEWVFLDDPLVSRVAVIVGEAHAVRGHRGRDIADLLPDHDVTIIGDGDGTCEFRAILR